MKVLVTGGSGFIGQALVRNLCSRGLDVLCALRGCHNSKIPTPSIQIGDIDADTNWQEALRGIDVVIHLAGRAHVLREDSSSPIEEFRKTNVAGTLNLARQVLAARVRRMVFISTIGVLGNENKRPFRESDCPAPIEPYALSKWEAEQGLSRLLGSSGTELVIIRPPLVYGPNAPGNFGRLVSAVKKGYWLPLGRVKNSRTLVALDNLVDLIHRCSFHPAAAHQIFLAGDAEDVSTTQLLKKIGGVVDRPARLISVPVWMLELMAKLIGREAVVGKLCGDLRVDIGKARQLIEWEPPLSLDAGLQKLVENSQ